MKLLYILSGVLYSKEYNVAVSWLQREGFNQMEVIKVKYFTSIVNIKAKVPLYMNG